ncbi:uncharacterized protein LOC131883179 [Tigriopus californicus]|uniref:uncharacterized protein LOC131883179 n=1 Tax=Tigriopus californicus TaxID=6832 RepID=UPI0027DA72C7|nr:uncharacterized protein LOC131883179 [Tigriopus californicus]
MSESNVEEAGGWPPVNPIAPRPPNRPAHERLLDELQTRLSQKEDRRKFLQERFRGLREAQTRLKADRERIGEERTLVDDRLVVINKEVENKRNQLQKLRTGLSYLREEEIQNQIQNLEYQLRKNHYKPTEEKKIVLEIDRLNRSKKHLKEHNVLKTDLDRLRHSQRVIREQRDLLFRQRGDIKAKEDGMKKDINEIKTELDTLKVEVDRLFGDKRQAVNDFKTLENDYKKFLFEKREEQKQRRKEERQAYHAERQKEIEEIKANAEPYEEELKLISNLISYCLRFEFPPQSGGTTPVESCEGNTNSSNGNAFLQVPGGTDPNNPRRGSHESGLRKEKDTRLAPGSNNSSIYATPLGATPATTPTAEQKPELFTTYKKDETDETLFAGVSKKQNKRASRNERRLSKAKSITHNPEIFAQFGSFNLKPPVTTKEVLAVVDSLKEQQRAFEKKASQVKADRLCGQRDLTDTQSMEHNANQDKTKQIAGDPLIEDSKPLEDPTPRNVPKCLELSTNTYETQQSSSNQAKSKTNAQSSVSAKREEMSIDNGEFNLEEAFPSLPEPTSASILNQPGGFFGSCVKQKSVSEAISDRTKTLNPTSASRADVISQET